MEANIYISGRIGKDTTLLDVIRQYKSFDEPEAVNVYIDSIGGSVTEGDGMFDYLKGLGVPVTTYASKAYSIAAKVFTAGDTRIVEDADNAILIHLPWAKAQGNAEDFEAVAIELKGIENNFIEYYSTFLGVDKETASNLLKNETSLSGADAVGLNFATELKKDIEAVAIYETNTDTMKKEAKKTAGQKILDAMAAFINGKPEPQAAITLQDATGTEIKFPTVEEGGTPVVGDTATIEDAAIPDGDYIIPSMEDSTVTFAGGAITVITPKPEEETEILAEEVQEINVWTMEVTNSTFAVGDTITYKDYDDNEQTLGSGEFQLKDGRRVVTDATGVVVVIKEAGAPAEVEVSPEAAPAPEASFDELLKKVTGKVKAEIKAEYDKKLKDANAEIIELKRKIGSPEIVAEEKEIPSNEKTGKKTLADIARNMNKK